MTEDSKDSTPTSEPNAGQAPKHPADMVPTLPLQIDPVDTTVSGDGLTQTTKVTAPVTHDDTDRVTESSAVYPPYTPPNKPKWLWLLPLLLITLGLGLFGGRLWAQKQAAAGADNSDKSVTPQMATATGVTEVDTAGVTHKPVLAVETVQPAATIVNEALSAEGTISPKTVATVNGKVSGVTIDKVLVQEGDAVKKGQVLAIFDTDAMQQQIVQAQAEVAEAMTRFELAKKDAQRILPLVDLQAISQQEADRYVATANQAAASVAASKARLNNQNLNIENAKVTAPVSGVISQKNANVGSVPGQAPLFTIIENGQLEWQALIDPNKLGEVNVGTPVFVSLPKNQKVNGRVSRIAPTAENGSRQITVYADLANHPNARAGMYQRGVFQLGQTPKVTIPVSAVVTQDGYDYVMQVNEVKNDAGETIHRISRTKVSLGERLDDRVVLLEPLKGKANIVRQGGSFLSDGDVVRIADTATTTPAT